jgi:hypothetical protein
MAVKVLIKRDSVKNFTTNAFVPQAFELVSAYSTDSDRIIYKIGDGKTAWVELPEITEISNLDKFNVYCKDGSKVEIFLNPFIIKETLNNLNREVTNQTDESQLTLDK